MLAGQAAKGVPGSVALLRGKALWGMHLFPQYGVRARFFVEEDLEVVLSKNRALPCLEKNPSIPPKRFPAVATRSVKILRIFPRGINGRLILRSFRYPREARWLGRAALCENDWSLPPDKEAADFSRGWPLGLPRRKIGR